MKNSEKRTRISKSKGQAIRTEFFKHQMLSLKRTLDKFGVSKSEYGLSGYGEDRLCIEILKNGKYQVYYGYRGHKTDQKTFPLFEDAAVYFLDSIAESAEDANAMIKTFHYDIHPLPHWRDNIPQNTSVNYKTIKTASKPKRSVSSAKSKKPLNV